MGELRIVAGRWSRRRLRAPTGQTVRPTSERVREAWMNAIGGVLEDARILDLFAGSGALGLEALSRGADHVTFVERDRRAIACLRANITALDAGECTAVVALDVFDYLKRSEERFDVALADPPYRQGLAARLVARFREKPFARILSVEHEVDEQLDIAADTVRRRYGDTALTFVDVADFDSEEET